MPPDGHSRTRETALAIRWTDLIADLWDEARLDQSDEQATSALKRYLETADAPADEKKAWERLA
jgi:hypothetical protein